jgi:GTP-binding protein EngB required for normal cell division
MTDKELLATVTIMLMAAQENLPRVPDNVKFHMLIIGRANAGKTTILQRVCGTTESPDVCRVDSSGRRKRVRTRP